MFFNFEILIAPIFEKKFFFEEWKKTVRCRPFSLSVRSFRVFEISLVRLSLQNYEQNYELFRKYYVNYLLMLILFTFV